MEYIIEAFSWGTDLFAPDVYRCREEQLDDAKIVMNRYWGNPKCFHVRIISPIDAASGFKHNLYCMKSRPTTDRELRLFFERVTAPEGVKTIRGSKVNVLRVCDFPSEIPASRLHFQAHQFYYDVDSSNIEEIILQKTLPEKRVLQLEDFETCLAVAAFLPSGMDAVSGCKDDWWFFLSEVDVVQRKAKLTFSQMAEVEDFVQ